jgi:hypothetical protein
MSVGIIPGNIASMTIVTATVDLGSVAANTSETETATVLGVKTGDWVAIVKPSLEAGQMIGTCWVSATDTVSMTVMNTTGSGIDAASETMYFLVIRPEKAATRVIV